MSLKNHFTKHFPAGSAAPDDVGDTCGAKPAELCDFCMAVITEALEMESNLKKIKIYLRLFLIH